MPAEISFAAALALCSAFGLAHYARRFTLKIKRRWEALSAGVAVAYVFINVMPELEEHRRTVAESVVGTLLDAEKRIYLWALAGFVTFTGLSKLQYTDAPRSDGQESLYRLEMAGFAVYMLLVGYLLVSRSDSSYLSMGLYVFAMALHAFMLDHELVEQFEGFYEPWGR